MRIPQVTDRIKEAPTHALRAVFAGIGQLLLVADRLKQQAEDRASAAPAGPDPGPTAKPRTAKPRTAKPGTAKPRTAKAGTAKPGPAPAAAQPPSASPAQARWRSLDKTGNVRLLSAEDLPHSPVPAAAAEPTTPAGPVTDAASLVADKALPVPDYDSLSLPSLRARLRSLDAAQVSALADYERSHAGRADVVAMFERRIAKLAAEG